MFYDNLKTICEEKGVKITPIVAECGGAKGSISNWKNGASPNSDIVARLSVRLNVSSDRLIFGKEKAVELSSAENRLLSAFKKLPIDEQMIEIGRVEHMAEICSERTSAESVPMIHMRRINIAYVAAGAGISTPFTIDNAFSEQEFPADEIPTGADCGVPINGDSMEPEYPNGCIVWVKQNADVKYGDCIIAVINGEPFFKIFQKDGLHSYNANYKPIKVNEDDKFNIFGKVIGYYSE